MNRRTLLIGASALGLAAFAGGAIVLNRRRAAEAEAVAAATPTEDQALLFRDYSPSFGPADAPVTLVEFFDPSCEACRAYHPVVQEIRRQFPTQVRVVLRYTVFHEGSDEAVRILDLRYTVLTSVTRDDLADGGAAHFAAVIRAVRAVAPDTRVELLIPDFQGDVQALAQVCGYLRQQVEVAQVFVQ